MKKIIIILCVGLLVFSCKSKKGVVTKKSKNESTQVKKNQKDVVKQPTKVYANNTERYIDVHKATAQQEMSLYGIPASITIAQGILESGSGNGRLSVEANNHFGIKCHGWTGKKIYHDDDEKQECFRKYKDAKYSFRDHSLFLTERKRYSKLFTLKKEDYKGWAKGLKAAGYATDRKYPQKLIGLIERYKLYEFDKEVLGDSYVKFDNPLTTQERTTYTVVKGDTLYSISRTFDISVKELQNINGLRDTSLSIGQVLVVKPSSKIN
ncbi:MAG: glucosaminidase domain-containing protein [Algibacter sp.]|uniref:glucosaminidase domain-containing protein n=1 Tax=Algibacter sp. TaxID=1872428 RepID=UPI0026120A12|nr:glucosaminidase domain-containing protein [Algibacter sp.]MDG1730670.1 glucosaminidase domain-containing protein [Algibacter sp.]MDG2177621.1 glucosaminidase domain-containing protein [Algibacter sp.]